MAHGVMVVASLIQIPVKKAGIGVNLDIGRYILADEIFYELSRFTLDDSRS